jgi:hypothetical protein
MVQNSRLHNLLLTRRCINFPLQVPKLFGNWRSVIAITALPSFYVVFGIIRREAEKPLQESEGVVQSPPEQPPKKHSQENVPGSNALLQLKSMALQLKIMEYRFKLWPK